MHQEKLDLPPALQFFLTSQDRTNQATGCMETHIQLPTNTADNSNPPSQLSRKEGLLGFVLCLIFGLLCLLLSTTLLPFLALPAVLRKYVLLHSLGSLLLLSSFAFLWGPLAYAKSLFSRDRIAFTSAYLFSLMASLYSILVIRSAILGAIAFCAQLLTFAFFFASNIPGGRAGLNGMLSVLSWSSKRLLSAFSC